MTESINKNPESALSKKVDDLVRRIIVLENVLCLDKEVLTLEEAALFMGISRSTLYKMTHKNVISFFRSNGKLIYFEKSELLAWMRKNRVSTNEEVSANARVVLQNMAMK